MDMDDSDQEEMDWDRGGVLGGTDADSQDELTEEELRLGFRPQRRLPATRHLPYSDQLDQEAADNLAKIKLNLANAVLLNDIRGFQLYTQRLAMYLSAYHLFMSKEDHLLLVRLYLKMVVRSHTDYKNIDSCSRMIIRLLKKAKRYLTRDDLEIQWLPLYQLYKSFSKHPFRAIRLNYFHENTAQCVKVLIRTCRSFFPVSATSEILSEMLPELCPFDSATTWVLDCLEMLLPTDLPPQLYPQGWHLWLSQLTGLLALMENSGAWDQSLCLLFSRLAMDNPGQVDWSALLPEVFSRLLRSFGLPISYKGAGIHRPNTAAIAPLTAWIVAMLGGGSETQTYLERLFEAVESYFYASNAGQWQEPLSRFMKNICIFFVRRYNRERYKKPSWEHYTAEGYQLTDDDVTRFVKSILPCALHGIYSWTHSHEANKVLKSLAQLRPELVITPVIESFHQSLESITEPHRLTSTMNAVSAVLRTMAENGPRPELVPLLEAVLPGIDPNDKLKTMCTFVLIDRLADMITFVDCSSSADDPELTEMEQQACLQTSGMEDVVLQLISRFLALLEPNNADSAARQDNDQQRVSHEENVLLTVLRSSCFSILIKSSPEIQRCALKKLRDFVIGKILETRVAGKMAAFLCCGAIMANPEVGLKYFIPPITQTIISLSEEVETNEEKLDQELVFNLLLLKEMVGACGQHLMPYRRQLETVVDRCRHLERKEGSELAAELLHSLLTSLLSTYITDYGCWRLRLADTSKHHLLIREWGKCTDMRSLQMQWHVPSQEELQWAAELVNKFVLPELEEVERFMTDVSRLNNEQLLCRLGLIYMGLKGACYGLPPTPGPIVNLWPACKVDLSPLTFETGSVLLPLEIDLRSRVIDVMHRLVVCMNEHRSDDTKSLGKLGQILEAAMFHFGVRKGENEAEIKILFNSRATQGKDFGPKKYSSRTLAAWVQLQHNQRVIYKNVAPMTETLQTVIADLLTLSVNQYSYVRQIAQVLLGKCLCNCVQGYLELWPRIVRMLQSPDLTHEQHKGLLFVVLGHGYRSLVRIQNWELAEALWPAIVTCPTSEKDSIVRLMEKFRKEADDYEAAPVEFKMSPDCAELVEQLWETAPSPPGSCPAADPSSQQQAAENLQQQNRLNRERYDRLMDRLLTLLESGTLHWRRYELCLEFLCPLIRPDIPVPVRLVRLVLANLLHTSIFVRKSVTYMLGAILKQQKPVHPTVPVDPCSIAHVPARPCCLPEVAAPAPAPAHSPPAAAAAGQGGWRAWPGFGERPDNLWLQYDSQTAPRDAAQWSQPRYVHKMKWGYSCWPREMRVYQQCSEPRTEGGSEAEREVRAFFTNPETVSRLVGFLSLEENKGRDLFYEAVFIMFKGVFRNHGEAVLNAFQPEIERLSQETTESAQKCLCEIIAGLIRGSKHWPFGPVERMWRFLLPLLRSCIARINLETADNWAACVNHSVADRDPNRHHWFIELMMEPIFGRDESLFMTGIRLHLMQTVIGETEWRGAELLHRVQEMVLPHLDHPYQNIRQRLGGVLSKVYHMDVHGGLPTLSPLSAQFVRSALPRLDLLLTTDTRVNGGSEGANGAAAAALAPALPGPPPGLVGMPLPQEVQQQLQQVQQQLQLLQPVGALSEERQTAHRILQTVCQYLLCGAGTRLLRFVGPEHVQLLPYLCAMESYDIDRELQADCVRTLHALAVLRHDASTLSALLVALDRVMSHPYWRVRVAGLAFLQAAAFHNMFLLLRHTDMAQTVTECVVRGLHDPRVEVREMAVQVFSGLLHCGFIDKHRQHQLRVQFEEMAATRLHRRRAAVSASAAPDTARGADEDRLTRLRSRHTGVLGLCAFVAAAPYDVPEHLPEVLMVLGDHANDPQPIQATIRKTMTNFKRTHHENWRQHKQKFTDDQLTVLTDLLVSPSYYA